MTLLSQATPTVTGVWKNEYQYRMYDSRTHTSRLVFVCALDGGMSEPEEVEDVIAEYKERFVEELKDKPDWVRMPLDQQHELAPHLRAIEASKRKRRETGNPRYYPVSK